MALVFSLLWAVLSVSSVMARCRDPLCLSCLSEDLCNEHSDACPPGYGYPTCHLSCQECEPSRCTNCECLGTCRECEAGFTAYDLWPRPSVCVSSIGQWANCKYWRDSRCEACRDGFYINNAGVCEECSQPNCNNCASYGCTSCAPGYGQPWWGSTCAGCLDRLCGNCRGHYWICISCVAGAFKHNGVCTPKDYTRNIGTCSSARLACPSKQDDSEPGVLYKRPFSSYYYSCRQGYYMSGVSFHAECVPRECNIDNCEYCEENNANACERCGDGHLLQHGHCEACSIPHCRLCLSLDTCLVCEDDYITNTTTGECYFPEFDCGEFCTRCHARSGVCLQCDIGYYYHLTDKLCVRDENISELGRMMLLERNKIHDTIDPLQKMIEIAAELKAVGETRNTDLHDEIAVLKSAAHAARNWDLKRELRDLQNIDKMIRRFKGQVINAANGVTKNLSTKRNVSLMRQLKRTDEIRLAL